MRKSKSEIDSMELKLFDKRGNPIFKWNRAPGNIKSGVKTMRTKGIDIRRLLNDL